jgi:hypothetical protein
VSAIMHADTRHHPVYNMPCMQLLVHSPHTYVFANGDMWQLCMPGGQRGLPQKQQLRWQSAALLQPCLLSCCRCSAECTCRSGWGPAAEPLAVQERLALRMAPQVWGLLLQLLQQWQLLLLR